MCLVLCDVVLGIMEQHVFWGRIFCIIRQCVLRDNMLGYIGQRAGIIRQCVRYYGILC